MDGARARAEDWRRKRAGLLPHEREREGGLRQAGTTAERPQRNLRAGRPYFDTDLGIPIWYDGTDWVDATGASA